ncbi:MAG: hemerythrin domain-containing protein [Pseudomonadota bacterium]
MNNPSPDTLDLETRTGLPEHLLVLAERYPRDDWDGHPNFNDLTRFWLDRHIMFRKAIGQLVEQSENHLDSPAEGFDKRLLRLTHFFLNQLHGHHSVEDHHYFPLLKPLEPRLVQGFDILDRDHHALDEHIHGLAEATQSVLQNLQKDSASKSAVEELRVTQSRFSGFLHRHLADEEELIVPVILETGGPDA